MKISAHFHLEEFVPPELFHLFGAAAMQFIDPRIINIAEFERDYFGKPVVINNWNIPGISNPHKERGFRDTMTQTGALRSQHKFGRAIDRNIDGMTPQEHYAAILAIPKLWIDKGLTTLEDIEKTPSWVHSDCRNTQGFSTGFHSSGILIVQP